MVFIENYKEQYFRKRCHWCKSVVYATLNDFLIKEYNSRKIQCPKCNSNLYLEDFSRITKRRYDKELDKNIKGTK